MALEAPGTLVSNENPQYLHTLLCGEEICQSDIFFVQVVSNTMEHLNSLVLVLCEYFSPVNSFSKQKRAIYFIMRKLHKKIILYTDRMIDHNKYLSVFPVVK